MPRPRPNLPRLAIPQQDFVEQWLDRFDHSSNIDEQPEFSLNLGAESPASIDDTIPTPPPPHMLHRRRSTYPQQQQQRKRDAVDRDCGICFEYAVQPSRMLCCGKIFCREHIKDWLHGPSADGHCPSCSAPCTIFDIMSLPPPTLRTKNPPTSTSQAPESINKNNNLHPARARSQSMSTTSTQQSSNSTTTTSSLDSSILGLSPAPEEPNNHGEEEEDEDESHWLVSYVHALSRSTSRSSLLTAQRQTSPPQHPHTEMESSTTEVVSRLASLMGLTLLLYILFAS